jgi:hypothetical protein
MLPQRVEGREELVTFLAGYVLGTRADVVLVAFIPSGGQLKLRRSSAIAVTTAPLLVCSLNNDPLPSAPTAQRVCYARRYKVRPRVRIVLALGRPLLLLGLGGDVTERFDRPNRVLKKRGEGFSHPRSRNEPSLKAGMYRLLKGRCAARRQRVVLAASLDVVIHALCQLTDRHLFHKALASDQL